MISSTWTGSSVIRIYMHERNVFYRYLLTQLIGQQKHPVLLANWFPIPGNELFQLNRLSIPMGGTLTVYEQCFEEKQLNNTQVYNTYPR